MTPRLIVLAAGGTGGHLFPAEALARELMARGLGIALVTDRRGQAFGERLPGVALHRIPAGRPGGGIVNAMMGAAELALGTFAAGRLLRALGPAAVVGFGGYPSVPTMFAAARLRLPTLVHEQNALLGRANRLLVSGVRAIATSFPSIDGLRAGLPARIVETGNPVRPVVSAVRGAPYAGSGEGPFHLLVLGGSQGARVFSEIVPAALAALPTELRRRIVVAQQARPEDLEGARRAHEASGVDAELATFFDDVPQRLERAHLVLARAGASTVAELAVVGRPALLVPYPHAADDHQTANARAFAAAGGGWMMPQGELTAAVLAARLAELMAAPERLAAAAGAAFRLGRPDAAARLADLVVATAGGANGEPKERAA